jgi:hypothetical protein
LRFWLKGIIFVAKCKTCFYHNGLIKTHIMRTLTLNLMRIAAIVLSASALLVLNSCKDDNVDAPKPTLTVEPAQTSVVMPIEGGTQTFTVTTNQPDWQVQSSQSWLTVDKTADGFTITAQPLGEASSPEPAIVTVVASLDTSALMPVMMTVTQMSDEYINVIAYATYRPSNWGLILVRALDGSEPRVALEGYPGAFDGSTPAFDLSANMNPAISNDGTKMLFRLPAVNWGDPNPYYQYDFSAAGYEPVGDAASVERATYSPDDTKWYAFSNGYYYDDDWNYIETSDWLVGDIASQTINTIAMGAGNAGMDESVLPDGRIVVNSYSVYSVGVMNADGTGTTWVLNDDIDEETWTRTVMYQDGIATPDGKILYLRVPAAAPPQDPDTGEYLEDTNYYDAFLTIMDADGNNKIELAHIDQSDISGRSYYTVYSPSMTADGKHIVMYKSDAQTSSIRMIVWDFDGTAISNQREYLMREHVTGGYFRAFKMNRAIYDALKPLTYSGEITPVPNRIQQRTMQRPLREVLFPRPGQK